MILRWSAHFLPLGESAGRSGAGKAHSASVSS